MTERSVALEKPASLLGKPANSGLLQRQCACGNHATGGECESCKSKKRLGLQTKLKISQPGDSYEQEADRVADQIMATPVSSSLSNSPLRIHRYAGHATGQMDTAPASVDRVLAGSGSSLEPTLQKDLEQRFGHDFLQVRVHTGSAAEQSAREVNANAYTVGHNIVFGAGQYSPGTNEGRRLIAHELTHVIQQSGTSIIRAGDNKEYSGMLQRTPEQAQELTSLYTSWGDLDETALGSQLLRLALRGQLNLADKVITALGSKDRDDVAYEFMLVATDPQLDGLSAGIGGRRFLHRLFDELTSGSVAAEEQQQADRILRVTARQTVSVAAFERAATSRKTKIFPFSLPGFTVVGDAPIEARRERGGIWVHSFVRVLGTAKFRAETATLPTEYFLSGIVLPETEVIGVRLYDQGGIIHYTTPLFLIQLANATNQRVLEKILEAAGIGLILGTGALAGLGVEASMAARVLLWADRAAFVLGTVTSVLHEHRSWLVEQFGSGFMDAIDIIDSAAAIYGIARVAIEALGIMLGLRSSYSIWREQVKLKSSSFSDTELVTINQITQSTDELIKKMDDIKGAQSTPQMGKQQGEKSATGSVKTTHSNSNAKLSPQQELSNTLAGKKQNQAISELSDPELQQIAPKNNDSAINLVERYEQKPEAELKRLKKANDQTAKYVHPIRLDRLYNARAGTGTIPGEQAIWDRLENYLMKLREKLPKTKLTGVLGVAETDLPLKQRHFYGGSIKTGDIPNPAFKPKTNFPRAQGHAEQNILGRLSEAIQEAGLDKVQGSMKGKKVWILVDQEVCTICRSGLYEDIFKAEKPKDPGVIKQFSTVYKELTIEITDWGTGNIWRVRNGRLVH